LQEFWPLQALCADLHADWPLHAFAPSQCIVASSAEAVVLMAPRLKSIAAAAAMAAPDIVLFELNMNELLMSDC
jgi:hypothetical protein